MKADSIKLKILFPLITLFLILQCATFGLVSSDERKFSQEYESKTYTAQRSFLKAKQWFTYRLGDKKSKILVEDPNLGKLEGTGFIRCRVPYGVEEVDVEFHEFKYKFQLKDTKASFSVEDIYSYSLDPSEIVISYGPRNKREAVATIRLCFEPLAEDLFTYIQ
ncbi:MAG: DUF4468 domain-containing protein [Leptospira sp.]|nr:DUF4468 domain-containing protein [Leptospira sp.]NCS92229.1 DUF4468 domain-containing protein [Leptospira sp.]